MICYQPWEIWCGLIALIVLWGGIAFIVGRDIGTAKSKLLEEEEKAVIDAALNWHHWHGYIPNLSAAHYEVPLIKATRALMATKNIQTTATLGTYSDKDGSRITYRDFGGSRTYGAIK